MSNVRVTVGGKGYTLQRIPNRDRIQLSQDVAYVKDGKAKLDLIPLLDYCFEHVIIPDSGPKLRLDAEPGQEGFIEEDDLEAWQLICNRFLNREFAKLSQWQKQDPQTKVQLLPTEGGN